MGIYVWGTGCGIPYPRDVPDDIELHYVETYRSEGPYGAAGCGEAPLDAPHPAILNAMGSIVNINEYFWLKQSNMSNYIA